MKFGMKGDKNPPSRCDDCGKKLDKPSYQQVLGPHYIKCTCGAVYIWSYPEIWRKSHVLPLWRFVYGNGLGGLRI
jgi:hypothetical protein